MSLRAAGSSGASGAGGTAGASGAAGSSGASGAGGTAGASGAAGSSGSGGASFVDDFSSGIRSEHWTVSSGVFDIDDTQGEILISKGPGDTGAPSEWAKVLLNHTLDGDFDVSVDYGDAALNACQNQIQLNLVFGGQYAAKCRQNWWAGQYSVWLDPPAGSCGTTATTDMSGTLRVTRSGTMVSFYANSELLHQADLNDLPVTSLWLSLQNNGSSDAISATFDNFSAIADGLDPCAPHFADLVARWRAENNALDCVENHDGRTVNEATYAAGKDGAAFSFDGVDDYISIDDAVTLRPAQFPVQAWVSPRDTDDGIIVEKRGPNNPGWDSFVLWIAGSLAGGNFGGRSMINNTLYDLNSGVAPQVDTWTHLALTYGGSMLQVYVDGERKDAGSVAGTVKYGDHPLTIGNDYGNPVLSNGFYGNVDDVALFRRALTAGEVQALYNPTHSGLCVAP